MSLKSFVVGFGDAQGDPGDGPAGSFGGGAEGGVVGGTVGAGVGVAAELDRAAQIAGVEGRLLVLGAEDPATYRERDAHAGCPGLAGLHVNPA